LHLQEYLQNLSDFPSHSYWCYRLKHCIYQRFNLTETKREKTGECGKTIGRIFQ
jgi:hypothetical protein